MTFGSESVAQSEHFGNVPALPEETLHPVLLRVRTPMIRPIFKEADALFAPVLRTGGGVGNPCPSLLPLPATREGENFLVFSFVYI